MQNNVTEDLLKGYNPKINLPEKVRNVGIAFLAIGIILGLLTFALDSTRAVFNYLLSYSFLISIGVGALFLIALEYIVGADWSVPFRRVNEFLASIVPLLLILVIPLLFSLHTLFHWTHQEALATDKILQGKAPYLNESFFYIRTFVFIGLWILFYFVFIRNSRKQDETKDQSLTKKNITLSAVFIPVFAVSITFSAIDWIMSLEPHWFSTIYGVYFFAGSVVATLAVLTFIMVKLKENNLLHPKINEEHFYNLGALLFAFINFWAYIAFSQYILIWYANLPEETFWYLNRWQSGWIYMSILLIIVHFIVPYAVLLSQPSKMNFKKLKFVSVWLVVAHFIDLYWLITPHMHGAKTGFFYYLLEFSFPIFAIGVIILVFYYNTKKNNILPIGDPKLSKGLKFKL